MMFGDLFSFSRVKWQKEIVPFPTELKNIHLIKILHMQTNKCVEFTKKDIEKFLSFMQTGNCNKIMKGMTRYQIKIEHEKGNAEYFIDGESLRPQKSNLVQAAFTPRTRGFEVFLHSLF
jgi:hypothetical protein